MDRRVLCVGEVLWDALPLGLFLGGAPFNVACHLHMLGVDVAFASRVGNDMLGREVLRRMQARGMDTSLLQEDAVLDTGFVEVSLDPDGLPAYVILEPVAWDFLACPDDLAAAAQAAELVVFGSLAQRDAFTRRVIRRLWQSDARKVFDVNLRPPYVDRDVVEASLSVADVVKLNDEELALLAGWWDLPDALEGRAAALAERFGVGTVCVTRGAHGAVLLHDGQWADHPGYEVEVRDTVGAGDAFLAGFLSRLLRGAAPEDMLGFANRLGAYVASQFGATPSYHEGDV